MPTPADADVLARRAALARAVNEELAVAGLPVVPNDTGLDRSVAVGALVSVDPLDDESGGGVFVEWVTHFVLASAAMDALSEGREGDPSLHLAGTVASAMQDAIAEILSAAGYTVAKDVNDMAPFQLQVKSRQSGLSWRDWLDAQTARREEALRETANNRTPHARGEPPS
ncbi:hypothetical protein FHX75_12510 [Micromonospora palomenae]|uniref:Uncharacterized protein n=2 Tax=Micromonospora palomenae TaxID=1461247 RepID=A0A561WDR7_9ACTN|nr:hypothetical protein FHX75_12510 [Micromonospora palomenae]